MAFWISCLIGLAIGFAVAWAFHRALYNGARARDRRTMAAWMRSTLRNTYDRAAVDKAFLEIDQFDAGAIDAPLQKHIFGVRRRLATADESRDTWLAERSDVLMTHVL